jgi:uncharacterized protein DUF3592
MKSGRVFLVFFTLFWSGIVLLFDGVLLTAFARQIRAEKFPSTTGTVTHSEVTLHRGSKGSTTYGVNIRYRYLVDDKPYDADRFRYGFVSSSDRVWAQAMVAAHPRGSQTQVFYDPANPAQALLSPGLQGSDFFVLFILTPFNAVMIGLWSVVIFGLWRKSFRPEAGGAKVIRQAPQIRVRLPSYSPAAWALLALAIFSFLAVFAGAWTVGMHGSLGTMQRLWLVVLGAAAAVYAWRWARLRSGKDDLVIDEATQMLDLPLTLGRKQRVTIGLSEIRSVAVERVAHRGSKGGTSYTYAPTLQLRDRDSDGVRLADWYDQDRAEAFADWLRQQLGRPAETQIDPQAHWTGRMPLRPQI